MAKLVNLTKNKILTITGGVAEPQVQVTIEDWEAPIIKSVYGNKVTIIEEPKTKKKSK